jgi:hypothetical protein
MRTTIRFATAVLTASLAAVSLLPATTSAGAASGSARPTSGIPFDYWVHATTTLAKLNQTVTIPRGTFTGTIDLTNSTLRGSIKLPEAKAPVSIAGLPPLATATFKISEVGPVTGTINLPKAEATATAVFNIQIVSVTPAGLPMVNLVGNSCTTSKPISVTISGKLTSPITFSGLYTIPPLKTCGAATTALNQVVPGPNNKFTAVATPKKH